VAGDGVLGENGWVEEHELRRRLRLAEERLRALDAERAHLPQLLRQERECRGLIAAHRASCGLLEDLVRSQGRPSASDLESLANRLSGAFSTAGCVGAVIALGGGEHRSQGCRETAQQLTREIHHDGRSLGSLGLFFSESPALSEEARQDIERFLKLLESLLGARVERTESETVRLRQESVLRAILESIPSGVLVVDRSGAVSHTNALFARLWRIPSELLALRDDGMLLEHVVEQLVDPEGFLEQVERLYGSAESSIDSIELNDGRCIERVSFPLLMEDEIAGRVWSFTDVTMQRQNERSLRASEERYRAVAESSLAGIAIADPEETITYANQAFADMLGHRCEELVGMSLGRLVDEDELGRFRGLTRQRKEGLGNVYETVVRHREGHKVNVLVSASPLSTSEGQFSGTLGVTTDISERKRAESELRAVLEEKEVLLKEIHHRVKNNLQIVASLLRLQERGVHEEAARRALVDSRMRVLSMARIHEQLYGAADLIRIDMESYLEQLCGSLRHLRTSDSVVIRSAAPGVSLPMDLAIPCGLLINELVMNALTHAFEGRERGEVHVELRTRGNVADAWCFLTVRDNGVGLPPLDISGEAGSLGLRLVSTLTKQVDGTLEVEREEGTVFRVSFPLVVSQ
jgi:PAS domain S-box-containing protein